MLVKRVQQNPLVAPTSTSAIPVNLDLESKYEGKKSPKINIFHALTFGFIFWGLFYLLDLIKIGEFFYFLLRAPRSTNLILYIYRNSPYLMLVPLILFVMLVAHIIIIIKLRTVSRTTSVPALAFTAFSTIVLVVINVFMFSEMNKITRGSREPQPTPATELVEK